MNNLPRLDEAEPAHLTVRYAPDDASVSAENPPRFSWLPDIDAGVHYALTVEPVNAPGGVTYQTTGLQHNFHAPPGTFAPGEWRWHYCLWDADKRQPASQPSRTRTFTIPAEAVVAPGFRTNTLDHDCRLDRPRLWLNPDEVAALRTHVKADPKHAGWDRFYAKSVTPWTTREPVPEPAPYPGQKRVLELWRKMYIDCQEILYGIRHQAIAGVVLDDASLRLRAKTWLLHTAAFDVRGTTSRAYNDEAAFRIVAALAWGYDWLHGDLNEAERERIRTALSIRLEEVVEHVIDRARIHTFPYDSHAVRALGMVIIPCSIALLGEHPRAREWLAFSIDYYDTLYSPWGGADGGWAEGPHYWTTALAYFSEAANLLRKYCKHDVRQRAFFRNTGYFPLYTKSPDSRRGCFCDDPTLGELPSIKVGYLLRDCAAATGNGWFQWYFDQLIANDTGTEDLYYNYGWWSLPFDDLCFRHDHAQVIARVPVDLPALRHFDHVGWVGVQRHLDEPAQHVQLVTKCSRYGSISHSHADQGAFTFFAYGEDLAIQSGYYIGHNTSMHRQWRRQTKSKNALVIDGRGQYAGDDKAKQIQASGRIIAAVERADGVIHISVDPGNAYRLNVPELKSYQRDFYLLPTDHLLVVDQVALATPLPVDWLLHTLHAPAIGNSSFRVQGEKVGLTGEVVFCASGIPTLTTKHGFDDVDRGELGGLAEHHRVVISMPAATHQAIAVLLSPHRTGESNRLFHFLDDQGFATNLYFQDSTQSSFNITLAKNYS